MRHKADKNAADGKPARPDSSKIKCLDSISMHDPVYAGSMNPDQPPPLVFCPSRAVLHKIMRICTHITDLTDLYYFF